MRIVHVTQPVTEGVAAVVLRLAIDQRERGWVVDLVCPPSGWLPDRARAAGVTVHPWPATRGPGPRTVAETLRLSRILRRLDPEVVHLHSSKAGLAGRLAVRGRRPTVFQPHMWSFHSAAAAVCVRWERFAARWTSQLVCVSDDELADGVTAGVSTPAEVVCNGVDIAAFQPSSRTAARRALGLDPDAPLAVCVGRLAWLKGQDQLLAAWPSIVERVPSARLALVGDGPMAERWQAGTPASVLWCGRSDRAADWYAAADVVVMPSRAEGMALVPLEAMACGRSVVAFDVGGVRQSVAGAGAVVPAGDVTALADAVAVRLADAGLAGWEGQLARTTAERSFDQRRMCEQVAVLTEKLV